VVVLLVLLIVTNLATLGALAWFFLRPTDVPRPDAALAGSLDAAPRPAPSSGATRRVITIEILNPIELAGTRGRIAGIAGSLAPRITRRIVYDQAMKLVRRQLAEEHVVADVRLHVLRPVPTSTPRPAAPLRAEPGPTTGEPRHPTGLSRPVGQGRPVEQGRPVGQGRPVEQGRPVDDSAPPDPSL
jgi:hypothetical protein